MIKTSVAMLISDIFIASALTYLSAALFAFIRKAKDNVGKHEFGSVEAEHFFEHAVAGGIGFFGCVIGAVSAVIHMILQNVEGFNAVPIHVEIIGNFANGMLFLAASLFVHHMIKEEDPNHPFYYRHHSKEKMHESSVIPDRLE